MRFAYFVVEGPHDAEFLGRFLRVRELRKVDTKANLDTYWHRLLPKQWPQKEEKGDLVRRVRVPAFYMSDDWSVAVDSAEGDSKLVETVCRQREALDPPEGIEAIGMILDADDHRPPNARFTAVSQLLAKFSLPRPAGPGLIAHGPPRLGIYVLPDNNSAGTLEDVLLDCAGANYPTLRDSAAAHVQAAAAATDLTAGDMKDFNKPAGKRKATVGAIASILRPGKAIQVSVQDNRWVDGAALELPRIKTFLTFVNELLS